MTDILNFMLVEYRATGNCWFPLIRLQNKFGHDLRGDLNDMWKRGWIRKRKYVNGDLVELIKFD